MNDRSQRANARLADAHRVLKELDLLDRLRAVGEPMLVGSVPLDVVVRPDIDIEVYTTAPSAEDGFGVISRLVGNPHLRAVRYKNSLDQAENGLYWRLDYELDGTDRWTIDLWIFPGSLPTLEVERLAAIRQALTPESRDAILAIKEAATARGERAHGHWVYRAVLDAGVTTYEEYLTWLGDQDVWERVEWWPRETDADGS